MGLSFANIVQAVSIAIFSPCLILGLFLASRLGWGRKEGWFLLVTFCALRIAGDSISLYLASNKGSTGLYVAAGILSSVGLSPLMIAISGFMARVDTLCHQRFSCSKNVQYLLVITQLPIVIAVIVSIVGGVQAGNNVGKTGAFVPNAPYQAGAVLYVISFVLLVVILGMILSRRHAGWISWQDELLIAAVTISLPLLLIRVVYLMIVVFGNNPDFALLGGSELDQLCMETLEEYIMVIMFLVVGCFLKRIPQLPDVDEAKTANTANMEAQEMGRMDGRGYYQADAQSNYPQRTQPSNQPAQWEQVASYLPIARRFVGGGGRRR